MDEERRNNLAIVKEHQKLEREKYKEICKLESERDKLIKERAHEITRLRKERWQAFSVKTFEINQTEGKIRINGTVCAYSKIRGADLNVQLGSRITTTEDEKSKQHVSVGGAVAGGLLFGLPGALAGGVGLGKTTTKGYSQSQQIPTCLHLGIFANLNGSIQEIVLINHEVDQNSSKFNVSQKLALEIVSKLRELAATPEPKSYIPITEEAEVRCIDDKIESKKQEIADAQASMPTYASTSAAAKTGGSSGRRYSTEEESLREQIFTGERGESEILVDWICRLFVALNFFFAWQIWKNYGVTVYGIVMFLVGLFMMPSLYNHVLGHFFTIPHFVRPLVLIAGYVITFLCMRG